MTDPEHASLPGAPAGDTDALTAWLDTAGDPGGAPPETIDAAEAILLERKRQIDVEGFTPDYDEAAAYHQAGRRPATPLALAAAAYALGGADPCLWPFGAGSFKPRGHRENMVRAGALILAEIERIDRAAAKAPEGEAHHG